MPAATHSARLSYARLSIEQLDAFHSLVQDAHVRQYMMDGEIMPREWSEERIRASDALFERRGVGLWLASMSSTRELVGFCGFLEIPSLDPQPQLAYALFERFAGRGLGTEMACTMIRTARETADFAEIVAGVDAVNQASCRILHKLGFSRVKTVPGAFGDAYVYRLSAESGV